MSSGYLRRVVLRGELGERYGREHWLDVATAAEAVRAMEANHPGFMAYLLSLEGAIDFAVIVGGAECLDETQGNHPLGRRDLEFVPVVRGAGDNGGVWQIVGGIVLLAVVSIVTWGVGTGPTAAALTGAGIAVSEATLGTILTSVAVMGVAMALGGVASMIAGTPKIGVNDAQRAQDPEKLSSYQFSGPVNTAGQGNPVPVVYGELVVGSQVLSMGISTI